MISIRFAGWFLVLAACPLGAQSYSYISGQVWDTSNSSVPAAGITVVNEETGTRRAVQSQNDGTYSATGLEPGVYKMTVRKEGFRTVIRFGVRVSAAQPARVAFTMQVGSMQETITVHGEASPMNRDDASVGLPFTGDEAERLPLNGRGLLGLIEFAPGTVVTPATRGEAGQFTSNGQRPNTNYFLVDGVSANNGIAAGGSPAQPTGGALPGLSAFGSLDALISLEAVREFRVQTSTSVPEFGRLPGAIVSIGSRSGSNEFHGSVFYRFRNEVFSANDWFANRAGFDRAPLRLNNVGATLGGPVRKNRTFFFLSYETIDLLQPFAFRTAVPSLPARAAAPDWARGALNLFPRPNGAALGPGIAEWSGLSDRPSRLDSGSVKIDHAFTSRITVFARYREAPSFNEFGATQTNHLDLQARSLTLGFNVRPSHNLVLDLRLNASETTAHSVWTQLDNQGPSPCPLVDVTMHLLHSNGLCNYFVRFTIAGMGQLASGQEGDRRQRQLQVVPGFNWEHGSHTLRFGADWRRLAPHRNDPTGGFSVIADTLSDLNDERDLWTAKASPQVASATLDELSSFVQDTWRIGSRLTITSGLRWEYSPAPLPGRTAYFYDPVGGTTVDARHPLWVQNYRNFAPRLGLAWQLDGGRTVLRAGAGLYYDSSLSIATDLVNGGPLSMSLAGSAQNAPFSTILIFGFLPRLQLPRVEQWNVALEHALSDRDSFSAGYVGSSGNRLMRREIGGDGSSDTVWLALATNHGDSHYHGLQLQYRRRVSRGWHGLMGYTWSHSIDDSSSDASLHWAGEGFPSSRDRGSSDFDLRHYFSAALGYDTSVKLPRLWRGWSVNAILWSRTGFPISVLASDYYNGIPMVNAFRPNLVYGEPAWLADTAAPGGYRLNPGAFRATRPEVQGTLGRNAISGFGMSQTDLSLHRDFRLAERRALEVRVEAYNVFNHSNFGDPVGLLVNPLFGQSGSMLNLMLGTGSSGSGLAPAFQNGGPRSLQAVLRLRF